MHVVQYCSCKQCARLVISVTPLIVVGHEEVVFAQEVSESPLSAEEDLSHDAGLLATSNTQLTEYPSISFKMTIADSLELAISDLSLTTVYPPQVQPKVKKSLLDRLPEEILVAIFELLPVSHFLPCRQVFSDLFSSMVHD